MPASRKTGYIYLHKAYTQMRTNPTGMAPLQALSRLRLKVIAPGRLGNIACVILSAIVHKKPAHIVLADDDEEDRDIFIEVINEVAPQVTVSTARNGRELMDMLTGMDTAPDIIFLDLNMPLKNGQECLVDIRSNAKFKTVPVIIYSTSRSREHIDDTFLKGANFYFPKPDSFGDLKTMVSRIFSLDWEQFMQPQKDKFVLSINHFKQ